MRLLSNRDQHFAVTARLLKKYLDFIQMKWFSTYSCKDCFFEGKLMVRLKAA
jgi:hypothetical protein